MLLIKYGVIIKGAQMGKGILMVTTTLSSFLLLSNQSHAFGNDLCTTKSSGSSFTCDGVADNFYMTMKGFRLRKSGTDEFVVITTNEATYDFAASGAGETVGSYLTDGYIPPGTYDAVSPILGPTMTVGGSTTLSGGGSPCRTTTSGYSTDGGSAENRDYDFDGDGGFSSGSDAVEGMNRSSDEQYINGDGDFVLVDSSVSGFPITIEDGDVISFTMNISVAKSVSYEYNSSGTCTSAYPAGVEVNLSATIN